MTERLIAFKQRKKDVGGGGAAAKYISYIPDFQRYELLRYHNWTSVILPIFFFFFYGFCFEDYVNKSSDIFGLEDHT